MNVPLLLDTHALIWAAGMGSGKGRAGLALEQLLDADRGVYVSPISAWEIAQLVRKGRLLLTMSPNAWWERAVGGTGLGLAQFGPEVLMASSVLPELRHSDPADCILIATAREMGFCLVTRDRKILDYANRGHVMAVAC